MEMAIDCLAGYIFEEKKDGNEIPIPSEIENIDVNAEYDEYEQAFISLVPVDVEEYARKHFNKSVKKTLSIPSWLNEKAIKQNINFSQLLQDALIKKLNT